MNKIKSLLKKVIFSLKIKSNCIKSQSNIKINDLLCKKFSSDIYKMTYFNCLLNLLSY